MSILNNPKLGPGFRLFPGRVWGLTGGIASGKSTVARLFATQGFPVVDADQIARDLAAPGGGAHAAIQERFGTSDRQQIRKIVFEEPSARKDLESILHPLIQAQSLIEMTKAMSRSPFENPIVFYEAALLVETGRYREFERLVVVHCPREIRKQRLMARDGLSPELCDAILDAQASDEDRLKVAGTVIPNDKDLDALRKEVGRFVAILTQSE
jgi:dephospho-CoA kinase